MYVFYQFCVVVSDCEYFDCKSMYLFRSLRPNIQSLMENCIWYFCNGDWVGISANQCMSIIKKCEGLSEAQFHTFCLEIRIWMGFWALA